jgi:galactokinase
LINFSYCGPLSDRRWLLDRLTEAGLSHAAAARKAEAFAVVATTSFVSDSPAVDAKIAAFFIPGRIEVLGKHTDYAGGSSMVVAAERGFCLVVRPRDDDQVHVTDVADGETVSFRLDANLVPRAGHWSNYPMTVARRIARNFPSATCGADVAFLSDLPPAAGMSSSSAMIVAMFFALAEANTLRPPPDCPDLFDNRLHLAGYLGTVENGQSFGLLEGDRGVGTFGGSEDHTAILRAEAGHVSQFTYCPVRFKRVIPVPKGYTFAVGVSGVVAEKTGAAREKYNRASRLISAIVDLWRRETGREDPTLAAILAGSREDVGRLQMYVDTARVPDFPQGALAKRLEHFLTENEQILPAAGDALARADLDEFGRLVDASQRAAERLLENQIPQTSYLAAAAREAGAIAASAFGAGFGGGVWALVEGSRVEDFLNAWSDTYRGRFPQHADAASFFTTEAGPAALRVG